MLKAWEAMRLGKDAQVMGVAVCGTLPAGRLGAAPECTQHTLRRACCGACLCLPRTRQIAALLERCKRLEEEAAEKGRSADALRRKLAVCSAAAAAHASPAGGHHGQHQLALPAAPGSLAASVASFHSFSSASAGAGAVAGTACARPGSAGSFIGSYQLGGTSGVRGGIGSSDGQHPQHGALRSAQSPGAGSAGSFSPVRHAALAPR
jgi:hypothetical protein